MNLRIAGVFSLVALATSASAQNCNSARGPYYREAVTVCDRAAVVGPLRPLPDTCKVVQTIPACPSGFANPIVTDVTGVWHGGGLTLVLSVDANDQITGAIKSSQRPSDTPITSGRFDAATRTLTFEDYLPWSGAHGSASLQLSPDDTTLSGSWQRTDGKRGNLTLTR